MMKADAELKQQQATNQVSQTTLNEQNPKTPKPQNPYTII
jgi:hypothetical protein